MTAPLRTSADAKHEGSGVGLKLKILDSRICKTQKPKLSLMA